MHDVEWYLLKDGIARNKMINSSECRVRGSSLSTTSNDLQPDHFSRSEGFCGITVQTATTDRRSTLHATRKIPHRTGLFKAYADRIT